MQTLVSVVGVPSQEIFSRIEARAFLAGQRAKRCVACDDAHHRAVFRRGGIDVGGGGEAAGAGHVLRNDVGIAGQVLADMPRDGARPQVIAAAGAEADDHLYGLAGIVIRRGRLGGCGQRSPHQQRRGKSK